ncbi:immunity 49 family protein [Myxococcus sp. CA039A]|uniref:immunity 49 family protein n=1 Tax=Myxococcus sp. CA039A TaxID=2741737 RepID=UPI00157AA741|nr:immunity 49 family protein [Myxococcus sp. CA039A]NTX52113.1 immunity 49 family protein [Myxococcus sp. CA039A]
MDLETIQDNAWYTLTMALKAITVKAAVERSGRAYFVASKMYHRLAIGELLSEARTDRFQVLLCKSAQAQLHLLRLQAGGRTFEPLITCPSRNSSFHDALAAGQLGLAVELARLASEHHEARAEYEDDFLLQHFMHKRLLQLHTRAPFDFQPLLERWGVVVKGEHAPFLSTCRALLERDAEAFHDGLLATIAERGRQFRQKDAFPVEIRRTDGPVFIQGTALLRLAELDALPIQREYPTIPHFARLPVGPLSLPDEAWTEPEVGFPD